ncbi:MULTISPECIES: small, acid-soluble spore protein L [Sediminibacillus]|nr:small, acid-soluble spore protein L [Sediminibacillus terrae]
MAKERKRGRGQAAPSVTPQGLTEDTADQRPHSDLEAKAKKSNTKR